MALVGYNVHWATTLSFGLQNLRKKFVLTRVVLGTEMN